MASCKIIKSQYLRRRTSDRHQIFTGQSNRTFDFVGDPESKNSNSRWRTAAMLQNVGNAITRVPMDRFG